MTIRVRLDYRPTQLAAARQALIERHPSTRQAPVVASGTRSEELHGRVLAAQGDAIAIRRMADGLSLRDVRTIARALARWDDVRPASLEIIRRRPARSLVRTLWLTWEEHPDIREIADACLEMGEQYGWHDVAEGAMAQASERWLRAAEPGEEIRRWLAEQGLTYSDLASLSGTPLRSDTPLLRTVRDAVMTRGSVAQLRAEGAKRLLTWLPELSPEKKIEFGQHYLRTIVVDAWDGRVLEAIKERYGSPRQAKFDFFWAPLSQDTREAFIRWFLKQKLDQVFSGDTERHQYWSRHLDRFDDIETGNAGGTEYAWLIFPRFAVVEFFEVGNAAYFYPIDEAEKLMRLRPSYPGQLKERKVYGRGSRKVQNHLIHTQNWQWRADRMLMTWGEA